MAKRNMEVRKAEAQEEQEALYAEFIRDPVVQFIMAMIPQPTQPEALATLIKAALIKGFGAGQGNMVKEFMMLSGRGDKE